MQKHLGLCPDKMVFWEDNWLTKVAKKETNGGSEVVGIGDSDSSDGE